MTIALVMLVRLVINELIGLRGLIRVENSSNTRFSLNFTAPISITESFLESKPVVSISRETITGMRQIIPCCKQ